MATSGSRSTWSRLEAWSLPRLQDVVFLALFALVILLGPRLLNVDGDLGRHLTIGESILQSGRIPTADVFSHTMAGKPLTPHEWLAEVAYACAYRLLGLDGVVLLCALLVALTFARVYRAAVLRSGLPLASLALTLLAAAASSLHWLARPHLFTLLLVVLWTEVLEAIRRGERHALWRLPLLMLIWVNLHGAFVFGFVVWLAYVVDWGRRTKTARPEERAPEIGRQLMMGGGLSAIATLANPAGAQLWTTSIGYAGNAYLVGHTAEYLSPNFHNVSTWPFLFLILASFWLMSAGRARMELSSVLLMMVWMGLGLFSVRHVPVFAVLSAPILAMALAGALDRPTVGLAWRAREGVLSQMEARLRGHAPAVGVVMAVVLALASGVRLTPVPGGNEFSPSVFPIQAATWLEANPRPGNAFNYFPWGGYLLFRLWPDVRVFIDGQTDFYGEALTREYEQVITLDDKWPAVLEKYRVRWVIIPRGSRLASALESDPGWVLAYADGTAIVLERTP